jgi:hypothetical protein
MRRRKRPARVMGSAVPTIAFGHGMPCPYGRTNGLGRDEFGFGGGYCDCG